MTRYKSGVNEKRCLREEEELLFATAWAGVNYNGQQLDYMLDPGCGLDCRRPNMCSDRDQEVASTVIQWLGTNCGRNFLGSCGYFKKEGK